MSSLRRRTEERLGWAAARAGRDVSAAVSVLESALLEAEDALSSEDGLAASEAEGDDLEVFMDNVGDTVEQLRDAVRLLLGE